MIVSVSDIAKIYNGKVIFEKVSFHINEKDKVAIVGRNGSGKTTLLNIISGKTSQDSGDVYISKNTTIGYLSQFDKLDDEFSIYENVLSEKKYILDLFEREKELTTLIANTNDERYLEEFSKIHDKLVYENAYAYESEVKGIIKGIGFDENDMYDKVSKLSGGERTRVSLAKLLLSKPDILILDEPTNHLDLDSISWLENYLNFYEKTLIIVSHDRYFLDKVVSKVIEVKNKEVTLYSGNYTDYLKKSEEVYLAKLKEYKKQQDYIKHQEAVIKKLKQFNREKSIKRARSREKLLSKIDNIDNPYEQDTSIELVLEPKKQSGNDVLVIRDLCKSFNDRIILKDTNLDIKREDVVALIGPNGCGKTTLLKMILGKESYDGYIKIGANVDIGYYDQKQQNFKETNTVFDEIHDTYPDMTETKIRNILATFQFVGDDVFKGIKVLSGGERARLALCILMLRRPNFLILDEPTNHLDIEMKETLENMINSYVGTVLVVSHDRYFLNNIADKIINFEHENLNVYLGNYNYFLEKNISNEYKNNKNKTTQKSALDWKESKLIESKKKKYVNTIQKNEKIIKNIENEISENLHKTEEFHKDFVKLTEIYKKIEKLEEEMLNLLEENEQLSKKLEEYPKKK